MADVNTQDYVKVTIRKDDRETFELFKVMTKKDKRILATIHDRDKKKGHVSPAIMFLIKEYVNKYKDLFQKKEPQKTIASSQPSVVAKPSNDGSVSENQPENPAQS